MRPKSSRSPRILSVSLFILALMVLLILPHLVMSWGVWTRQETELVGSGVLGSVGQGRSMYHPADGKASIVWGGFDNGGARTSSTFAATSLVDTQSLTATQYESEGQEPLDIEARRFEYFDQQRRYPFAQIPPHPALSEIWAKRQAETLLAPNTLGEWTPLGPAPITTGFRNDAGRVDALAVDPSNPSVIYLGGTDGGLWKTTNAGASWSPLTDTQCSLAILSVALDPLNSNIVYAGTGLTSYTSFGCGILKSTNGGTTWTTLGGGFTQPGPNGPAESVTGLHIPGGQGSFASNLIYAATNGGLYKSTDAGSTWSHTPLGDYMTDVVTDPTNSTVVYAGMSGGVYKSTNGGTSFTRLGGGLPTSTQNDVKLEIAPSAPQTVLASIFGNFNTRLLFKSTDAGVTWTQLTASGITSCVQCIVFAVDPRDVNTMYVGGVLMYKSTDGGSTFSDVGVQTGQIHVDQHSFAFDPTNSSIIYAGNDGGVYRSADAGSTWSSLNTNLAITQFYPGISAAPTGPNPILGGSQDNGVVKYSGSLTWTPVFDGDGGYTAINPMTPAQTFLEIQWGNPNSGPWRNNGSGYSHAVSGINLSESGLFIPPLVMDESRPSTLYFGTQSLYRTTNSGDLWTPFTGLANIGVFSAIGVSPSDPNTLYVGTHFGELFVTMNGGTSFAPRKSGLPNRFVTSFAVYRSNPLIAYVTFSGYNLEPPTGHVFKTINGGTSWISVSGNLPDIQVNAIVQLPDGELYVGTEAGVYRSGNDGATWVPFSGGLPNVVVTDLLYHAGTSTLVAATYGRGMWSATINCPIKPLTSITNLATKYCSDLAITQELEANPVRTDLYNQSMQTAIADFEARVRAAGFTGPFLSATFRTLAYQAHLREVWDQGHKVAPFAVTPPECATVASAIASEFHDHFPRNCCAPGAVPIPPLPPKPGAIQHTVGRAIDVNINLIKGAGIDINPGGQLDQIAAQSGFYRPYPPDATHIGDPVHFEPMFPVPVPPPQPCPGTSANFRARSTMRNSESELAIAPVTVRASEQIINGHPVYSYRVVNSSSQPVVSATVGYDQPNDSAELTVPPLGWDFYDGLPQSSITSPTGWNGIVIPTEESSYSQLTWASADSTHFIAPGQTSDGFSVVLPNADNSYKNSHWTIVLADGTSYSGSLEPLNAVTGDTVQFSQALYAVNKDSGNATVTVTRSGSTASPATVHFSTSDGTATQQINYTMASGSLTFLPGETSKSFLVQIINNVYLEPDQTVNLNLSNASGLSLGNLSSATLVINHNSPSSSPAQLILETSGPAPEEAAALDSIMFLRDPFQVVNGANVLNLGVDRNTRVIVFVMNLQLVQGETSSSVVVNLTDSTNQSYDVAAEVVRLVPNFDFTQVIFRLPDNLSAGTCTFVIKVHGQVSNLGTIRIRI